MTHDEFNRHAARLMRETADLLEQGLVQVVQIDTEFDLRHFDDYRGDRRTFSTGGRTVTLKIVGHDGTRMPDWGQAMDPERPQLPRNTKLLGFSPPQGENS